MKQETVKLNYLKIAPRKVRLLASTLRGLSYNQAIGELSLRPQRSSSPLMKLIKSAGANIKNNQKADPENFFISEIMVNQGPILKRMLPRARGSATPIHKIISHVVLTLSESDKEVAKRFNIIEKEKPKKDSKKTQGSRVKKHEHEKDKNANVGDSKPKDGIMKKLFRRKSV